MAGAFGNEPAEIWVFGDGRYSSDMRPGGSRYHHYEVMNGIRAERDSLSKTLSGVRHEMALLKAENRALRKSTR